MFSVSWPIKSAHSIPDATSQYNRYKQYLINSKIPDGTSTTVYRCGPMIDLCVGPHIPDTGRIEAMKVTKARPPSLSVRCAL